MLFLKFFNEEVYIIVISNTNMEKTLMLNEREIPLLLITCKI